MNYEKKLQYKPGGESECSFKTTEDSYANFSESHVELD
jgi:hypothetical protein